MTEREIFEAALDLSPDDRAAFLDTACGGDAALRQRLAALVRGELDWIVMRCLEKDRNRRYETANGLAMDL